MFKPNPICRKRTRQCFVQLGTVEGKGQSEGVGQPSQIQFLQRTASPIAHLEMSNRSAMRPNIYAQIRQNPQGIGSEDDAGSHGCKVCATFED
jgi:hypothetical protein